MNKYRSWGNFPAAQHDVRALRWRSESLALGGVDAPALPFGQGRSYGDSCLNDGGLLLVTAGLNRFMSFDVSTGVLRCEAGVTLAEILDLAVPEGWFLPVTPGTKYVSIGGAIANDVHGKNHHRAGTLGRHVRCFELLRSNEERLMCSSHENVHWFQATIGGLGLTGLITWVEIQLKPIKNAFIYVETLKFYSLEEFFQIAAASVSEYEYTVAWVDCLSHGKSLGRGLFMRGNHAAEISDEKHSSQDHLISLPFDLPGFALNHVSTKIFNTLYFHKPRMRADVLHYGKFFYPLDAIGNWNRLYGTRGFLQYQCVVPDEDHGAIRAVLSTIAESGMGSFLSVLKTFGELTSPGMLSFPRKGVTLALDFSNEGEKTLRLLGKLDETVSRHGGVVYPAKDARMSAWAFQNYYPQWQAFAEYVDPKFSSGFWRRVSGNTKSC